MRTKILLSMILCCPFVLHAQMYTLGWTGDKIVPDALLLNPAEWICNQSSLQDGDSCFVTADTALHLHWRFGAGTRGKFAQCYLVADTPFDLSSTDVIGIDIHGQAGKSWVRHVELKFESGGQQAAYTWENLAHINRWCERLVIMKTQFSNSGTFNWNSVKIISFAVTMNASDLTDVEPDAGTVSFRNIIGQSADNFIRAEQAEPLTEFEAAELANIRLHAATALKNRQKPTGLLTTWLPDGSSWLYGQGLALRALTEEGAWNASVAADEYALAAEKLAHFLSAHQAQEGYWPRAWNAGSGNIIVRLEGDNTVWMGDFPWIPGSLAYYYRKSGDASVLPAIVKAKSFLYELIEPTGKVNTQNMVTLQKSEVSNYEGYAAVLYCLLELGDTATASKVMEHVMTTGWNEDLRFWNEGPASSRPVLLVNTWMAALASSMDLHEESLDALSMAGKLLYTRGRGEPYGFDGVGPVATWYEGTLSYIAAAGPGSNALFNGIHEHINADGTVPAYNENLGSMAGIWAVDWPSLDATSWLYFAAARKTPFGYSGADPDIFTGLHGARNPENQPDLQYWSDRIYITGNQNVGDGYLLNLYNMQGALLGSGKLTVGTSDITIRELTGSTLRNGVYILVLRGDRFICTRKFAYCHNE